MKNTENFEVVEIWIVTDGKKACFRSLSQDDARLYAETANRHRLPSQTPLVVERRSAILR